MANVQVAVAFIGGTNVIMNPTTTIKLVTPQAFGLGGTIKNVNGATLAIVGSSLGTVAGGGYLMGTSEAYSYAGPASFYLASGGATVVVGWITTYSMGVTIP